MWEYWYRDQKQTDQEQIVQDPKRRIQEIVKVGLSYYQEKGFLLKAYGLISEKYQPPFQPFQGDKKAIR